MTRSISHNSGSLFFVAVLAFFAALTAFTPGPGYAARSRPFGLGFVLGDPSGFTGKYYLSGRDAIDGGVGDALGKGFYLYGDYLRHFPLGTYSLKLYFGGGAAFHHYRRDKHYWDEEEENRVEGRMPLGVDYRFDAIPVEAFFELVPALRIIPDVDFTIRAGLGARYFF